MLLARNSAKSAATQWSSPASFGVVPRLASCMSVQIYGFCLVKSHSHLYRNEIIPNKQTNILQLYMERRQWRVIDRSLASSSSTRGPNTCNVCFFTQWRNSTFIWPLNWIKSGQRATRSVQVLNSSVKFIMIIVCILCKCILHWPFAIAVICAFVCARAPFKTRLLEMHQQLTAVNTQSANWSSAACIMRAKTITWHADTQARLINWLS